ncbi:hypothetical protein [Actinacidiphila acididurans]|uniref:Uncharacterized protein n=1 Tax=Actinacidiphila acididurans TaxID=2784346 RepID=A0ABS2U1P8_9ACTN|nr:hypothetical protein [Actinacidiphila acididurans]MBM9509529.1 hypothetical protein [Actinacidiphila acididurans]
MPDSAKVMTACTLVCLVLVVLDSLVIGADALLWSGWVVLGLCTAGVLLLRPPRG